MSKDSSNSSRDTAASELITAEAASWLAQLDSGSFSASDKLALAEWMSRSPRHRDEIRRLESMWSGVDQLIDHSLPSQAPPSLLAVLAAWVSLRPASATLASLLVVLMVAVLGESIFTEDAALSNDTTQLAQRSFTYAAPRGQQRMIPLNDGSLVYLNSNGIVEVRYDENERQIRLLSGDALFEVAKNPKRPFRVYAGRGRAEAVGTAFMVRLIDREFELIVTEGRVKLDNTSFETAAKAQPNSASDLDDLQEVMVTHGQRVSSNDMNNVIAIDEQDIARYTAWMYGKHIFQGDTLKFVVDEINRHSSTQIVIADPALGELRMGGVFELGEVELFLSTLSESLNVEVRKVDENLIYIERGKI